MQINTFRRPGLTRTPLLGALLVLPLLLNCQGTTPSKAANTPDAEAPAAAVEAPAAEAPEAATDPCSRYAAAVCKEISPEAPECAAIKAAAGLMPPAACDVAIKDIAYTTTAYKKPGKPARTSRTDSARTLARRPRPARWSRPTPVSFPSSDAR